MSSFVLGPGSHLLPSSVIPLSMGGGIRNATSATMHYNESNRVHVVHPVSSETNVSHSKTFKQNSKQWSWSRISREAPTKPANSMVSSKRNPYSSLLKPGSRKIPFSYQTLNHISSVHIASLVLPERAFTPLLPD